MARSFPDKENSKEFITPKMALQEMGRDLKLLSRKEKVINRLEKIMNKMVENRTTYTSSVERGLKSSKMCSN